MFLLLVALCGGAALGDVVRISDASEFKGFSDEINNGGANYYGSTVFLDADINLISLISVSMKGL